MGWHDGNTLDLYSGGAGSSLGQDTGYPDRFVVVFSSVLPVDCEDTISSRS
jgi:hypothetical protein